MSRWKQILTATTSSTALSSPQHVMNMAQSNNGASRARIMKQLNRIKYIGDFSYTLSRVARTCGFAFPTAPPPNLSMQNATLLSFPPRYGSGHEQSHCRLYAESAAYREYEYQREIHALYSRLLLRKKKHREAERTGQYRGADVQDNHNFLFRQEQQGMPCQRSPRP
jgi:hypothetical protein